MYDGVFDGAGKLFAVFLAGVVGSSFMMGYYFHKITTKDRVYDSARYECVDGAYNKNGSLRNFSIKEIQ